MPFDYLDQAAPDTGKFEYLDSGPSYLSDVATNAVKEAKALPAQIPKMAEQGLGIASAPIDALKAIPELIEGKSPSETSIAQDVSPIVPGVENTAKTIAHPVESFRQAPINTAMTAAGLFGLVKLGDVEKPPTSEAPVTEVAKALPTVEPTETMYHGTSAKAADAIRKGGFNSDKIFVTKDKDLANQYAKWATEHYNKGDTPEIMEVQVPKSELAKSHDLEFGEPVNTETANKATGKNWTVDDYLNNKGTFQLGKDIANKGINRPAPMQIPFQNEAQEALGKAKEVKDYISRGYEGFAKKPGAIADVADYIQGKSQMAATQQMGATPLQARQIGHEGMRAIGQYALDNGIVGPTVGLRGMRLRNTELLDNAGKTLGDLRKQADSVRNPLETPVDTLQAVRQKLDPEYMSGTRTGAAEYQMALKNIENSDASFEGMAKTATKLNKLANEANRLNQPHGPYTDVANEMSRINNERIKQLLGPQKAAQYEQALKEYGVNKKISEFLKRKEAGEVKRLGPGSLTSNLTQKMMDEIGYKTAAKVGNKVSTSILKNPSIAKSLPSLFKEFTHQIEDVGQEVTGMYEGGVVPKDVGAYVQTRNQKSGSKIGPDLAEAKR
jgi:hypothetical protein